MLRRTLLSMVAVGLLCLPAAAAETGEMVGVDDDFWGTSIGQVDNSLQMAEPYGVFNGSVDMTTVNGWLAAGGIHSFALIPPAATYYGNASMPLAGVPDVGIQEVTLTFDDFSSATVPIINAAFIKRGIPQGAQREFYEADMTFHDHESPDCNPVNGGPRPILYQVDLSAHQGKQLAFDAVVDLRAGGYAENNKIFDVYEVTEDYDYTTVTYSSLVYDGNHPELPPLAFELEATQDSYLTSGNDTPTGTDTQHCITANASQNKAIIYEWDIAGSGAEDLEAAGDGVLSINIGWDQGAQGFAPSHLGVYEMTGDAGWDEATVTAVNYCLDGQVPNILGDFAGSAVVENTGNFTRQEIPVAEATITKLLNGEITGLAISSVDAGINACIRTTNTDWTLHAEPTLKFSAGEPDDPTLPGDANGDGVVSDADYTIWADNYGASGATFAMGDFNGDGEVSDADYTIWADNYGAGGGAVPEPATMALVALGGLAMIRRKR